MKKQEKKSGPKAWVRLGKIGVTFLCVTAGWIFFRADNFGQAFQMLEKIIQGNQISLVLCIDMHIILGEGKTGNIYIAW